MKSVSNPCLVTLALLFMVSGCAHWGDPCENKLLTRTTSPDRNYVISTYHRECSSKVYTTANIEKPPNFIGSQGEVVCYIVNWGDRHPIEAVWKDDNNIFIRTSDKLEKFDFGDSKDSCGNIKIAYDVNYRNEQQTNNDPELIAKIRQALATVGPCVNSYYKEANESNDPVARMNEMIERGERRSAVENILGYTYSANCSISQSTYDLFRELSVAFDLKPHYIERVENLVNNRAQR